MSALVTDGLGFGPSPLVSDDLGGGLGTNPSVQCFESMQFPPPPLVAPTLSALETQILTPQPDFPITELFRSVFVNNCSTSSWNVAIARTVIFYANSTEVGNVLNQLYPGLHPDTGILCKRVRTTQLDLILAPSYTLFRQMMNEMLSRGIPQPYVNYLTNYIAADSSVYRVCDIAVSVILGSICTLRGT